jgi:CHAT domain-containing protein
VARGRDLLRKRERSASELMVAFGNPDFGDERSLDLPSFENIRLSSLSGTAKECSVLQEQAESAGKPSQVLVGPEATEAQLLEVNSPQILHLATHGFFFPETDNTTVAMNREYDGSGTKLLGAMEGDRKPGVVLKNPMYRSGLALAGAQATLDAWAKGEVPPTANDGIVTAEEVGGLKLEGTWLVVLSACDTGTGEARAGEGVMGLRRGFIQAGAQNLLMTLWPINDEITVEIMKDFYAEARRTGNAPEALSNVQRNWLVKLRKEQATGTEDKEKQRQVDPIKGRSGRSPLQKAVNLAGPFIMSSQGTP